MASFGRMLLLAGLLVLLLNFTSCSPAELVQLLVGGGLFCIGSSGVIKALAKLRGGPK